MTLTELSLVLVVATAALLALAFWWIRRTNLAVYPAGRGPVQRQPLPTGCDLGQQLLLAATAPDEGTTGGGQTRGGIGRGAAVGASTAPSTPKRKERKGPTRRAFLRGMWGWAWLGTLSGFAGASLMYLWPNLRGGFGAVIDVDTEEAILEHIRTNREPYPYPSGRMYLVEYDPALDPEGQYAEITNGASVMALYQKCVHLGCRVPWCQTSQWFECPCHGSRYNRWGEWQGGPAPRGLDRFSLEIVDGRVHVDTGTVITGPSRQARVLDQPAEGPSCL